MKMKKQCPEQSAQAPDLPYPQDEIARLAREAEKAFRWLVARYPNQPVDVWIMKDPARTPVLGITGRVVTYVNSIGADDMVFSGSGRQTGLDVVQRIEAAMDEWETAKARKAADLRAQLAALEA